MIKRPHFDSKALREGARDTFCVLHPGVPTHSCAHLPTGEIGFGGGVALKCPDYLIADACQPCHFKLDHGEWRRDLGMRWKFHILTMQRRFDQGILIVRGEDHTFPEWEFA